MAGTWGNKIKISIFGESHGKGIGVVIDGLEPGIALDMDKIYAEMARRAPGQNKLSTARSEKDMPELLSGFFEGRTTGTPLMMVIHNTDTKSRDYEKTKDLLRPGHADYTGYMRYKGFNDYRGGGHFSGRITAPLVFAGAVAKQILEAKGIHVGAHIQQIADVTSQNFGQEHLNKTYFDELLTKELPVIDTAKIEPMKEAILQAKADCDSVGGIIECSIIGVPAGIGNPFFDSVESTIAHLAFSVPAVKGIEFGLGFDFAGHKASEVNDCYDLVGGTVCTSTNHNGGVLGGITSGMPIVFRTVIKPTPSIAKPQSTIHHVTKEKTTLEIEGRHDPCIVQRAIVVIEAIGALAVLDLL